MSLPESWTFELIWAYFPALKRCPPCNPDDTLCKWKRRKKVPCLPEHRTPWAMSPHMKLAQYSHQCGPRNVWTCEPKRRKVSENSVTRRQVALDMNDTMKQMPVWEEASLARLFLSSDAELQTDLRKQRCTLISENSPLSLMPQARAKEECGKMVKLQGHAIS